MSGSGMSLSIAPVTDAAGLETLRAEWDDLLSASAGGSVFLRFSWISTWWQVFGPRFGLLVLTARDGAGRLVGVAPLMTGPGPGRLGRRLPHLLFIGQQGDTLSEQLDFLARRGLEAEVMEAFAEHVVSTAGRAWQVLLLERVPADSPTLSLFETALARRGIASERVNGQESPYLPLPSSFDALLASRSRNFRRQWRNARARLAREGEVRVLRGGVDLPLEEAFDVLVALHHARWGEGRGSFDTDDYVAFHRALAPR
ncbi:MAG: GNAT family N-acetyltransferase, partial [Planctomycetota bacterium]